ncbi:MAG TPA: hypothetical protein DHW61_00750 [Lachnoclostridium phytofermentans]|uniref:HTH arsR-type domain-containing protein n=1 Tax=Lachnoclostridium phytofermentans TaxID=66219 RepID=A0A3D2X1C6_9FIRM|nr:metalloregulator ArsR/SmtB family transcription factor [Lachnoclostridium sp.]HCL00950.1 hypothetical protein [Lachnoclostridium phytofermentans]
MIEREIITKPDFFEEALNCYTSKENNYEILDNYEKFGMTQKEMQDYIQPVQEFCKQVNDQFSVAIEEFPKLKALLKLTDTELQKGSIILIFYRNLLRIEQGIGEFTREDLAFIHMLNKEEYSEALTDEKVYVKDVSELIQFLEAQSLEDAYKMRLISLYMDRLVIKDQIMKLKKIAGDIVKKSYHLVEHIVVEELVRMKEPDYLDEVLKDSIRIFMEQGKKFTLIPCISQYNALGMEGVDDSYIFHVGIYIVNLVKRKNQNKFNDAQLIADLKAISDTTRLKMLHMLSLKRMYIQEMAEELKLTPATVSHHINILLTMEYVLLTVDTTKSKKVYYELNNEKLEGLSKSILNLASERSHHLNQRS